MSVVTWDPKAREFLRKLDKSIADRIYTTVDLRISKNVGRYLEPVKGQDFCKLRVGDYRLFVDYHPEKDHLEIRTIEHRSVAYRRL